MKKSGICLCLLATVLLFATCKRKEQKAMYEGKDLSKNAQVIRDKETKAATLYIDVQQPWQLYGGHTVESIDFSQPLLEGVTGGVFSLDVADSIRSYFQLVTDEGKSILAERHLPMTGGYNFRDIGGVRTKDGRYVKWGKLFRTDDLAKLTEADLAYLSDIPVRSVVDFRAKDEMKMAPDRLPVSVEYDYNLNIEPGNIMGGGMEFDIDTVDFNCLMMDMNRLLVTDSSAVNHYREFFRLLQDEDKLPLMYHCSAGKDRTGMATALILYALGVDDETIMDDYLASAVFLADKYDKYVKQYPRIEPLMTVKAEFLQAGIDKIREDYGSVENYLTDVLNVDPSRMQELYLY